MKVHWKTFEDPSGARYPQIEVSTQPDSRRFEQVASLLQRELGGEWSRKLDGVDQRYWDLALGDAAITLHSETYLGISVYPTNGASANSESQELLQRAFNALGRGVSGEPI